MKWLSFVFSHNCKDTAEFLIRELCVTEISSPGVWVHPSTCYFLSRNTLLTMSFWILPNTSVSTLHQAPATSYKTNIIVNCYEDDRCTSDLFQTIGIPSGWVIIGAEEQTAENAGRMTLMSDRQADTERCLTGCWQQQVEMAVEHTAKPGDCWTQSTMTYMVRSVLMTPPRWDVTSCQVPWHPSSALLLLRPAPGMGKFSDSTVTIWLRTDLFWLLIVAATADTWILQIAGSTRRWERERYKTESSPLLLNNKRAGGSGNVALSLWGKSPWHESSEATHTHTHITL